jgi:hypothetical protein
MQIILENLYKAYFEARRNKRNTTEQLKFELNYESNLNQLYQQIITKTYRVKPCKAFVIEKPVYREVFAPQFIDRVVHHFIVLYINSQIDPVLINDCYSCRKGKGTLFGIERANFNIKSVTQNYAKDAYILKLDISGYFMNMNKNLLYEQIKKLKLVEYSNSSTYEKDILHFLIQQVIFTNPIHKCEIKGNKNLWQFIPNNKSLFHSPENCGLPIGNLTSQIFGNIYLNQFDHWVKTDLQISHYGRYVDDMYFMHNDNEYLKQCIIKIQHKMIEFGLLIHPKKIYLQHYTKGLHFLGRYIKPYRTYISNRTKNNFLQLINKINQTLTSINIDDLENGLLQYYLCRINSYWGLFIKANSYSILKKTMQTLSAVFYNYYYFEKYKNIWKCKLKNKYKYHGVILQPARI